jgi:hypothetical protein
MPCWIRVWCSCCVASLCGAGALARVSLETLLATSRVAVMRGGRSSTPQVFERRMSDAAAIRASKLQKYCCQERDSVTISNCGEGRWNVRSNHMAGDLPHVSSLCVQGIPRLLRLESGGGSGFRNDGAVVPSFFSRCRRIGIGGSWARTSWPGTARIQQARNDNYVASVCGGWICPVVCCCP